MKFIPSNEDLGFQDSNKIWIADYLDRHGIASTGSDHTAHEFELNKPLAKARALEAGLNTSPFYVIKQNQPQAGHDTSLTFPVFIKPTNRGGGLGIGSDSLAYSFDELNAKARSISENLGSDSLVEEYLPGREFSVAILKDYYLEEYWVMPIELIAPQDNRGARILSSRVKHLDTERSIEVTDEIIKSRVANLAIDVFHALGARDYGRIDIRLDKTGTPHFLEANLVPSLKRSEGNYFPKACALNINLDYGSMIVRIAELGLVRNIKTIEAEPEPAILSNPFIVSHQAAFETLV
jgi:D-alanine-D-alanine ligase